MLGMMTTKQSLLSVYRLVITFFKASWMAFLLVACTSAAPNNGITSVQIKLSVDNEALGLGSVVVHSSLSNYSGEDISFLPWNTPFDASVTGRFLIVTEILQTGESIELPYMGPMVKRMAPTAGDYVLVREGEDLQNFLNITKSYNFCAGHRYSVSFSNDLLGVNHDAIHIVANAVEFMAGLVFKECSD